MRIWQERGGRRGPPLPPKQPRFIFTEAILYLIFLGHVLPFIPVFAVSILSPAVTVATGLNVERAKAVEESFTYQSRARTASRVDVKSLNIPSDA